MSVTTSDRPDVEAYLAAVRRELADLRPTERDELLADVEASLLDAAEESDAPIAARLGPPADFAAELRTAAGLTGRELSPPTKAPSLASAWRRIPADRLRERFGELAPIWWLARAYVVVAVLAWLTDGDRSLTPPEVFRLGGANFGFVLLAFAVGLSVWVGFWERRAHLGKPALVLNLALALVAVPVFAELLNWVSSRQTPTDYVVETVSTPGLARDGLPVENIYPYSRDGRLLLDVLLYDQNGAPLEVRVDDTDPARRVLRSKNGAALFNSFPIRYFDPGTLRVAKPRAAPRIDWSPIVTPPLRKPQAR